MELMVKYLGCEAVQHLNMCRCFGGTCCIHLQGTRMSDKTMQHSLPGDQNFEIFFLLGYCTLLLGTGCLLPCVSTPRSGLIFGCQMSDDIWHVALEDESTAQTWMLVTITQWQNATSQNNKGVDHTTSKLWKCDHNLVLIEMRTCSPITVWSYLLRSYPCGVRCTEMLSNTSLMFLFVFSVSTLNV